MQEFISDDQDKHWIESTKPKIDEATITCSRMPFEPTAALYRELPQPNAPIPISWF